MITNVPGGLPIEESDVLHYSRGDVVTLDFSTSSVPHPEHGRQAIVLRPIDKNFANDIVYVVLVGLEKMSVSEHWFR